MLNLVEGEGFEPSKSMTSDLQSDPFGRSGTPPKRGGILIACHPTVKLFLIKNLRLASWTATQQNRQKHAPAERAPFYAN